MWKEKYLCLQKQMKVDIETLKENIYAECAGIMVIDDLLSNNNFRRRSSRTIKLLIKRIFK